MAIHEVIGLPPVVDHHPGIDRLGRDCRISSTVSVFRAVNLHANAGIGLGDEVILFDHTRLLIWEADTRLEIGNRVIVNVGCYLSGEGGLSIQDNVMIGPHARLLSAGHGIHGGESCVAHNPITIAPIRVGYGAWIGGGATVLQGISIGSGAVVGAGSVVTRDIPPFAIAVGNPARVIRYREGYGSVPWWRRFFRL